jgi:hypothetical protein
MTQDLGAMGETVYSVYKDYTEDSWDREQLGLAGAWLGEGGRQELVRAEAQGVDEGRS